MQAEILKFCVIKKLLQVNHSQRIYEVLNQMIKYKKF